VHFLHDNLMVKCSQSAVKVQLKCS